MRKKSKKINKWHASFSPSHTKLCTQKKSKMHFHIFQHQEKSNIFYQCLHFSVQILKYYLISAGFFQNMLCNSKSFLIYLWRTNLYVEMLSFVWDLENFWPDKAAYSQLFSVNLKSAGTHSQHDVNIIYIL